MVRQASKTNLDSISFWQIGMNAILASIAQVDSGDILEKKKSIVVMRKAQEEDKRTSEAAS